ncbi:MAG TPA: TIGR03790 family protein [Opitutae bacterium]|nr:TIGR03790 family protein [Opitutae bacterium]
MKVLKHSLIAGLMCLSSWVALAGDPAKVLIVANKRDSESLRLAEYYSEKRGIPKKNIIAFNMPREEEITWSEFVEQLYNPLATHLIEKGWIEGALTVEKDRAGRVQAQCQGTSIDYLVLCRGVPLKIKHEPTFLTDAERAFPPEEQHLNNNSASVDSELTLLAQPETSVSWVLPNPLFDLDEPDKLMRYPSSMVRVDKRLLENPMYIARKVRLQMNNAIVRVARHDGPTLMSAQALIDHALQAEQWGALGRVYIDLGGPYDRGNEWMIAAGKLFESHGFDVTYDEDKELFPEDARFDAPIFYFGWWSMHPKGALASPYLLFPSGALAFHLHSFSSRTLRMEEHYWVGPLVTKGVTGTMGYVYEPYLDAAHRPDLFTEALFKGMELGEAAYYATPFLSWQAIVVGDPLYRPFKVSLGTQLLMIQAGENPPNAEYAVIRKMNLLEQAGKDSQALAFAMAYLTRTPSIALALKTAYLQVKLGAPDKAIEVLEFVAQRPHFVGESIALARDAAVFLTELNAKEEALAIFRHLLLSVSKRDAMTQSILKAAVASAKHFNEEDLVRQWGMRLGASEGVPKAQEDK